MASYLWAEEDEVDGTWRAYPTDAPYVTRDQGLRAADDCVRVIIGDVADMLREIGADAETQARADALYVEACGLFTEEGGDGWTDTDADADAPEKLRDILTEAEGMSGISVEWNGDAGMVYVTASEKWQTFADADEARRAGAEVED